MRQVVLAISILALPLVPGLARADDACEKHLNDTKLMVHPDDAKIMCDGKTSRNWETCLVDVITRAKGKLRGADLFEVYGLCTADSSEAMRDCLVKGFDAPWNDKAYKGALKVGNACMRGLHTQRLKALQESAWGAAADASAKSAESHKKK